MKSRIYILINSLGPGGAERQVAILLKYLNFDALILLEKDIIYKTKNSEIIFLSSFKNKGSPILKSFYIPIYVYKLSKILNDRDIVISFLERSNIVNVLTKIVFNKHKAIISERTLPQKAFRRLIPSALFNLFFIKYLYHFADLITVNSHIDLREINPKISDIKVIPNPFEIKRIANLSKEEIIEEKTLFDRNRIIITTGRLTFAKGHWHLIRAFTRIKSEVRNVKLVILGEGNLRKKLETLIKRLNLIDDVFLLGFKENPFKYIAHSEVFILSSLWEGFPNALIEAMACKVPVISTNWSITASYILNSTPISEVDEPKFCRYGIIIPNLEEKFLSYKVPLTENEIIMADTIIRLLKDKKLIRRYSLLAFSRANDFDVSKIIKHYKTVLS